MIEEVRSSWVGQVVKPSRGWKIQEAFLKRVILEICRVSRTFPGPSQARKEGRRMFQAGDQSVWDP